MVRQSGLWLKGSRFESQTKWVWLRYPWVRHLTTKLPPKCTTVYDVLCSCAQGQFTCLWWWAKCRVHFFRVHCSLYSVCVTYIQFIFGFLFISTDSQAVIHIDSWTLICGNEHIETFCITLWASHCHFLLWTDGEILICSKRLNMYNSWCLGRFLVGANIIPHSCSLKTWKRYYFSFHCMCLPLNLASLSALSGKLCHVTSFSYSPLAKCTFSFLLYLSFLGSPWVRLCSLATETHLCSYFASVAMVTPAVLLLISATGNAFAFYRTACKKWGVIHNFSDRYVHFRN